jgi:YHS domain-containing protein
MKQFLIMLFAAFLAVLAGCATPAAESASQGSSPSAICHVCKYNNDLSCVCVKVDQHTPHTEYQGTTYYFCSDECKVAFTKRPTKYLPKPRNNQD